MYTVKVIATAFVTHNVKRLVVEKPAGYQYKAGQATEISIDHPALIQERRPFTFTSLNKADYLEFMIKIYRGHNGITEKLADINAGDRLLLHDVFGTISYQGPGLFIAGGAGITPFIAILRQLKEDHQLSGHTLLFANRAKEDIILYDELKQMLGNRFINVLEETGDPGMIKGFITPGLLEQYVKKATLHYYICGPDKFTGIMLHHLQSLGVTDEWIITEK